jgi:hypothetical protein
MSVRSRDVYQWGGRLLLCVGLVQCVRWHRGGIGLLPAFAGHLLPALVLMAMGWHAQRKPLRWWAHVTAVVMLLVYPGSLYVLNATVQGTGARSLDSQWQAWASCQQRLTLTGRPYYRSVLQTIRLQDKTEQHTQIDTSDWQCWAVIWGEDGHTVTFRAADKDEVEKNVWRMNIAEANRGK